MRMIQQCLACRRLQHPARPICLTCGDAENLEEGFMTGKGHVDSFTVVHRAEEPYVVARVRLVEGPIVLGLLVDDPEPYCDQPVRLFWWGSPVKFVPGHRFPPSPRSE